jgi:hypothetical protein
MEIAGHAYAVLTPEAIQSVTAYDAMCTAIARCESLAECADIIDKAAALREFARRIRNTDAERRACNVRLIAERRTGEVLKDLERHQGERTDLGTSPHGGEKSPYAKALAETNITTQNASRYQALADVPQEMFDEALHDSAAMPSVRKLLAKVAAAAKPREQAPQYTDVPPPSVAEPERSSLLKQTFERETSSRDAMFDSCDLLLQLRQRYPSEQAFSVALAEHECDALGSTEREARIKFAALPADVKSRLRVRYGEDAPSLRELFKAADRDGFVLPQGQDASEPVDLAMETSEVDRLWIAHDIILAAHHEAHEERVARILEASFEGAVRLCEALHPEQAIDREALRKEWFGHYCDFEVGASVPIDEVNISEAQELIDTARRAHDEHLVDQCALWACLLLKREDACERLRFGLPAALGLGVTLVDDEAAPGKGAASDVAGERDRDEDRGADPTADGSGDADR